MNPWCRRQVSRCEVPRVRHTVRVLSFLLSIVVFFTPCLALANMSQRSNALVLAARHDGVGLKIKGQPEHHAPVYTSLNQISGDISTIQNKELKEIKGFYAGEVPRHSDALLMMSVAQNRVPPELGRAIGHHTDVDTGVLADNTVAQQTVAPVAEESVPEEMFDFDGGGARRNNNTARSHNRSLEIRNAMAEYYNDRMREFSTLQEQVSQQMAAASNQPERLAVLRKALEDAGREKSKFESAWFQQNFSVALSSFENGKSVLLGALLDQVPASQIEGRAIWLDRGSIVRSGSEDGLRRLIRQIAASGFNVIFFETINAGYPMYPSQMVEQNPQVKGWDPLKIAVDEAHKQGVELHAWVWVFAVGNIRHNRILGQPDSFAGPVLTKPDMADAALRGKYGELVPSRQFEYWLSPANPKARMFLQSWFAEIVRNYDVDGLQLDYIRYPFQKPYNPMGFESASLSRFYNETGLSPSESGSDYTQKVWSAWKAFQVTSFVKEVNSTLKTIKPDLKLSAAVFPLARHGRMMMIQQDWETWVKNGWIDVLSPMAYSRSSRSLERLVNYVHNVGDDKTLVYPGLSLIKLNSIELLDALEVCRQTGVMGTTLFAVNQLDSDKQEVLQSGPYKHRKTLPPHRSPLSASAQLVAETQGLVSGMLKSQTPDESARLLQDIGISLSTIGQSLQTLEKSTKDYEHYATLNAIRDESRLLRGYTDQWASHAETSLVNQFQAKYLKQWVDKVVRLLNYATFQMAIHPSKS